MCDIWCIDFFIAIVLVIVAIDISKDYIAIVITLFVLFAVLSIILLIWMKEEGSV